MHIRISNKIGFSARIFGVAWVLNLFWEFAERPLYVAGTLSPFSWGWIRAATWDAGYVIIVYLVLAILHGDFYWLRRKNEWDLGRIGWGAQRGKLYPTKALDDIGNWAGEIGIYVTYAHCSDFEDRTRAVYTITVLGVSNLLVRALQILRIF